jgi:2-polyprenyl-6-methoxyphenol hydroxylase-like FAD-dependent oxidoreductase
VTRSNDPILVVGGGLGGASISLALARECFRVRLLEQAPEFGVAWRYGGLPLPTQTGAAA